MRIRGASSFPDGLDQLGGEASLSARIHAPRKRPDTGCIVIGVLAALHCGKASPDVAAQRFKPLVPLSEKAQSLADHLACRLVHAGGYFLVDQLFEFWSERDVHK